MKKTISITMSRRLVWRSKVEQPITPVIDLRLERRPAPALPKQAGWWAKVSRILLPILVLTAGLRAQNMLILDHANGLANTAVGNTATPVYSVVPQGNGFTATLSINGGRSGAGTGTASAVVTLPSNSFASISDGFLTPPPAFKIAFTVNGTEFARSGNLQMDTSDFASIIPCRAADVVVSAMLTCNPGRLSYDAGFYYVTMTINVGDASLQVSAFYTFGTQALDNVIIDGIVPIQVVTTPPSIPSMVPGKTTLIRAFLKNTGASGKAVTGISGGLRAKEFPDGYAAPITYGLGVAVPAPDANEPNHSINFILPDEWSNAPTLTLTAEALIPAKPGERNVIAGDPFVLKFDQRLAQNFWVDHLDFCFATSNGPDVCPGVSDNADLLARATSPVSEDRFFYPSVLLPPVHFKKIQSEHDAQELLAVIRTFELVFRKLHGRGINYMFLAAIPDGPSIVEDSHNYLSEDLANSPLLFADYCEVPATPKCLNSTVHFFAGRIPFVFTSDYGSLGPIGGMGFNSAELSLVPTSTLDSLFLDSGWLGNDIYDKLTRAFINTAPLPPTDASKPRPRQASDAVDSIVVSGAIQADGSAGRLDPVIRLPQSAPGDLSSSGTWCVRLHRASGADYDSCFELSKSAASEITFVAELPWYPDAARLSLFRRDSPSNELASFTATDPPFVSFAAPLPGDIWQGTQSIVWSGADPGGNSLTYFPMYSSDGGVTWLPLGVKTDQQHFDFDTSQIAGGTNVFFRVIASNGLSNSIAEIGPIEVRQNPKLTVDTTPLDFGGHTTGYVGQTKLTLTNSGTGPLVLNSALPDGSPFRIIGMMQPLVIAAGHTRDVMVRYHPTTAGQHQAGLSLTAADGTITVIPLKGSVADPTPPAASGPILVWPASYDFGHVPVNTAKDLPLTLRNSGQTALQILGVSSDSAIFQPLATTLTVNPGSPADLTIRVRPNAANLLKGNLSLRTNDANHTIVMIPVSVTGDAASGPVIIMNPTPPFNFGSVPANTSADIQVTLTNTGGAPLVINSVTKTNPQFTVVGALPPAVSPGTPQKMTLRFSPTAAGSPSDTWTLVTTPASVIPPFTVSGTATAPANTAVLEIRKQNSAAAITSYDFGTVAPNPAQPPFVAFEVHNLTTATVTVTATIVNSKFSLGPNSSALFPVGGGSYDNSIILFKPTDTSAQAGSVTFTANGQSVTVALAGNSNGGTGGPPSAPKITLTPPPPYNFGSIQSGTSGDINITATNAGDTPLIINSFAHANPAFSVVTPLPVTVSNGTPQKLTLRFSPTAAGSPSETWTPTTNPASIIPPFTVSGTATAPPSTAVLEIRKQNTAVAITSYDFGTISPNPASPPFVVFEVHNLTTATVMVTATLVNSKFGLGPNSTASFPVGGGSYDNSVIVFKPTDTSAQAGSVTFTANGQSVTVALTGNSGGGTGGGPVGSACIAPPANLVSWYSGEGNASDLIGGNAGSIQGGTTFATGEVGQAFQFNGSTGYVQLSNPANLRMTSGITLEAWINPRSVTSPASQPLAGIITKWAQDYSDTPNADSYGLWLFPSKGNVTLFSAIHQPGAKEITIQGGNVAFNAWTHVAMTFNGASGLYVLYINGQQVATVTAPGNIYPTNHNVMIGREDSSLVRPFDGSIDEVGIYSRALASAEIQAIFGAGKAGKCKP